LIRYRRLGRSRRSRIASSVVFLIPISGLYFFPPRASISFRTAISHAFISSGLPNTSKKLDVTLRVSALRNIILEKTDLVVLTEIVPSSVDVCDICNTQCFPGITSLAKAADVLPSCIILSGNLSKLPSPEYCNRYPEVTRT